MKPHEHEKRFSAIVDENRERFEKIARTYAGNAAEDLLQEILLQVWRSLPSFAGRSACSTWCYRIAINTALTYRRKRYRRPTVSDAEQIDAKESILSPTEGQTRSLLERFLFTLSEIDQSVLLMHMDRLSPSEIADTLGTSQAAVQTRLSRIKNRLTSWEDEND